ncbi:hypothetical protein UlMin_017132 [Ulmus minor]
MCVDEEQTLKGLLDAFGSSFSLKEIASAYCEAGRNADLASGILFERQGSSSTPTANAYNGEATGIEESLGSSSCNVSEHSHEGNGRSRCPPRKNRPVSVGSVSSIIGKDYVGTKRSTNGISNGTKPIKLDSKVLPVSALWEEEDKFSSRDCKMRQDMEEFMIKLLGNGFKLDRSVIGEVLDACGYDMPKSMAKLLDLSKATFDEGNDVLNNSIDKFTGSFPEVPSNGKKCANYSENKRNGESNSRAELSTKQKNKNNLEMDVMAALFGGTAERKIELPRRAVKTMKKPRRAFGEVVSEPLSHSVAESEKTNEQKHIEHDKDEDDGYHYLRRAVKEYGGMMREYYKAAVEAYVNGNHAQAEKLAERGQFFHEKAREADEESNKLLLETRKEEDVQDEIVLDLHDHGAKESIRLLKCHLSALAGIPVKHLKVIMDTNEGALSKVSRRRRVRKLLDEESIKWVEGDDAGTILIQLEVINHRGLSFARN